MSRRTRPVLSRRDVLGGLLALPAVALVGCGEGRAGPSLSQVTLPTLRVRLGRPRREAELSLAAGGFEMLGEGGAAFSRREASAVNTTLSATGAGIALGGRPTGASALRIRPQRAFTLDGTLYAGTLRVTREGNDLLLVNELDLETYTAGVIPNECAPGAQPATHRAQAVASRTYAYVRCTGPSASSAAFHVQDTESSQVYRGLSVKPEFGATAEDMLRRTAETRGVLLTWESRPFSTYFASTCGGHTTEAESSQLDPGHASAALRGVTCGFCATSPKYRWTKQVTDGDLIAGMKRKGFPVLAPLVALEVSVLGRGDWAREVTVVYGAQRSRRPVPGSSFRSAAGLLSHHLLDLRRVADGFEIDGAGWGHGVGMCQWGAFEMGKRGFSETDILRRYYPGITFTRMY